MVFDTPTWIHIAAYTGGAIAMGFGAIGAAVGVGYTAAYANAAISKNFKISGNLFKIMLVGQAIAESAAIFALVTAILLIFIDFGSMLRMFEINLSTRWKNKFWFIAS